MSTNIDSPDNPLHSIATEFVTEEFNTEIQADAIEDVATTIADIVSTLRELINSDDQLEALLRSEPGGKVLMERYSVHHSDPEPLTREEIIEPLFSALDYPYLAPEAGDFSDKRGKQADYSVSLADCEFIDSNRMLIEAEPLNKKLEQQKHGTGQVKDWLGKRHFEADFGIATDGMRWILIRYDPDTYSSDKLAEVSLQPIFLAAFENQTGRQESVIEWIDDPLEQVLAEFLRVFNYENFLSIADEAHTVIKEKKQDITDEFYKDYVRLVFGITEGGDARTARSLIGDGVVAPESATGDDIRLFSVELMNRLIFIKFLEDKGLVSDSLLQDLKNAHKSGINPDTFYKTYLEPLFFGVLDERPSHRTERIRQISLYSEVPYLNGGLFRPTVENSGEFTETDFDVTDSVLTAIIDLLERYSFSADGGPTDLDPSILGNVFEKTINYITTDEADQQKELGAYYTPDEITRFCAEKTVQPALYERFSNRMVQEWGWTEEMTAEYDTVYELIDALPETNTDVATDLLDVIDHFRALDPACGSGHFLTSVQSELVGIRKALYDKHDDDPADWELHKETVIKNIYGVDIVDPAVEIAKLRLWLSIIAEVDSSKVENYDEEELALPNVVFNIRQGNSLIGFTDMLETSNDGDQAQLSTWGPDSVRAKYGDIIAQVERHKRTNDTTEARKHLEKAEKLLDEYRGDLDEKILDEFQEAGVEDITIGQVRDYQPFHWVLEYAEVYADGGFDVVIGNPPWDVISASRDDFFTRYDPRFRTYSQEKKDEIQEELLSDSRISEEWEQYNHSVQTQSDYFKDSSRYELQTPTVAGKQVPYKNDLSKLFLERVFELARDDGFVSQVVPGMIFTGQSSKDLRMRLLNESQINALVDFENKGIFSGVDRRKRFSVVVFRNEGRTETLRGIFRQSNVDILESLEQNAVDIPRKVLTEYSPQARIFPSIRNQQEADALNKILDHPHLSDDIDEAWSIKPLPEELNETRDEERFSPPESGGDYPVYGGSNIHQFEHKNGIFGDLDEPLGWSVEEDRDPESSAKNRIREKRFNSHEPKRSIYDAFGGEETSKSQKKFVDDLLEEHRGTPLSEEDVLLDCTEYRIAYRDVTKEVNERTMIAAVIPKDVVCVHTLQTLRPYRINPEIDDLNKEPLHSVYDRRFTDKELFVAVGLLNSLPFDFLMTTKIDEHIYKYKLEESQVPRLTAGEDWFEYIWTRAAQLSCYGEEFAEMRDRLDDIDPVTEKEERREIQAEIDAAAFHAYGLNHKETEYVLEEYHRVQNPRMMTDNYFNLVLQKYESLDEQLVEAE
ncbi:Eco57I restriction-modification methylase domain-containing protein [Halobellus litoreus]|uniref:site-specific DNA-methyltransferase (adenine-specific) n=1 Tax=Halobellus litoreus TaxID=755310 RepID=A0ABD6DTD8_9EURY|nr:DNA methyltransferase [Halobellus litoreus]